MVDFAELHHKLVKFGPEGSPLHDGCRFNEDGEGWCPCYGRAVEPSEHHDLGGEG